MFDPKLKLSKRIIDKLRIAAQISGCASIEELAERILEKEADQIIGSTAKPELSSKEAEEIANSMKGLGYLE